MKDENELFFEMRHYQTEKIHVIENAIKKGSLRLKRHRLVNGKLVEYQVQVINLQRIGDNLFYQLNDNDFISDLQEMTFSDLDKFYLIATSKEEDNE